MKAVIIKKPGEVELAEVAIPSLRPFDVLIRVAYAGICGTDSMIYGGKGSLITSGAIQYPCRIGHEFSGIIEEVGSSVKGIACGDKVVTDSSVSCGECSQCKSGDYSKCANIRGVGTVRCWDGCFAEYIAIPWWHVYPLPDSISLEDAALVEPAYIALLGIYSCGIEFTEDSKVMVVGTGAIGLAAVALLKALYNPVVILSGRKDLKLEVGIKMGADHVINAVKEDVGAKSAEYAGGRLDAVIETSGNIRTVAESMHAVKGGGTVTLLGFYESDLNGFDIDYLVSRGIRLHGTSSLKGSVREIIELMHTGRLDVKPLITHRISLAEIPEAIRNADAMSETKIKVVAKIS